MSISPYLRQLRDQVGTALLQMPGVDIVIRDAGGAILLARHAENNLWAIPGGAIEPHETPAAAAMREAFEETGLVVKPMRVLGVYGGPEYHVVYPNGDEVSAMSIVFECQIQQGSPRPDGEEILQLQYYSKQELQAMRHPAWLQLELDDIFQESPVTLFQAPLWTPPADGAQHSGISNYLRNLRKTVGTDLLLMPVATGIVLDEKDQVLLQRRADTGEWSLPGGAIDPHERPADAVMREVWEETGVLVEPLRVVGVFGGSDFTGAYVNGDQVASANMVFVCRAVDPQIRLENDETLEAKFFAADEIPWMQLHPRWRHRLPLLLNQKGTAYFEL